MVEPKSTRQKSKTQDQHIYEEIFDAILEQRLWPGTRLKEESLGEIFGVSRTIIRRTLSRLAHERVAVFEPNRGAFVAEPDVSDARQILDARRLMELAIVERVAERASSIKGEFKKLYDLIEQEHISSAAADKGQTTGPYSKARLGRMVTEGTFSRNTLVWTAGQDGWKTAQDVDELAQLFTVMPPPPPQA